MSFTYRTHPLALIVKNLLSFSVVANSEEFCFLHRAGVEFTGVKVGTCEEIKSETSLLRRSSRSVLSRLKNDSAVLKWYYLSSNEWTGTPDGATAMTSDSLIEISEIECHEHCLKFVLMHIVQF